MVDEGRDTQKRDGDGWDGLVSGFVCLLSTSSTNDLPKICVFSKIQNLHGRYHRPPDPTSLSTHYLTSHVADFAFTFVTSYLQLRGRKRMPPKFAFATVAMAVALEETPISYEDLADIEREFDNVEVEISMCCSTRFPPCQLASAAKTPLTALSFSLPPLLPFHVSTDIDAPQSASKLLSPNPSTPTAPRSYRRSPISGPSSSSKRRPTSTSTSNRRTRRSCCPPSRPSPCRISKPSSRTAIPDRSASPSGSRRTSTSAMPAWKRSSGGGEQRMGGRAW